MSTTDPKRSFACGFGSATRWPFVIGTCADAAAASAVTSASVNGELIDGSPEVRTNLHARGERTEAASFVHASAAASGGVNERKRRACLYEGGCLRTFTRCRRREAGATRSACGEA